MGLATGLEAGGSGTVLGSGPCDESLRYAAGGDKMTPALGIGRGEKTCRITQTKKQEQRVIPHRIRTKKVQNTVQILPKRKGSR